MSMIQLLLFAVGLMSVHRTLAYMAVRGPFGGQGSARAGLKRLRYPPFRQHDRQG